MDKGTKLHFGSKLTLLSDSIAWNPSMAMNQSFAQIHPGSNHSDSGHATGLASTAKNWPALLILVIIFFTIGGNILVILAVSQERKLQNATNFFLRSLAMADMLVGILVMPVSLINILYNYVWPLPRALCPMWIFLDVLFSTASIMHLCAISLERYVGIRSPIQHSRSSSTCRSMAKVGIIWTISVVVSLPIPVMGLKDERKVFVNGNCILNDPRFVLIGSSVAFFIPLIIMVVCYYLTMRVLQQHSAIFLRDGNMTPQPSLRISVSNSSLLKDCSAMLGPQDLQKSKMDSPTGLREVIGGQGCRGMAQAIRNERRASKVLGVVFMLFLVMWCPFFVTNVLLALCQVDCAGEVLANMMNVFVWVGYISSGVNPLVYTLFNRTYRHAFSRYLCCRCNGEPPKPVLRTACQVYAVTPANTKLAAGMGINGNRNGNVFPGHQAVDQELKSYEDLAQRSLDNRPAPIEYTSCV